MRTYFASLGKVLIDYVTPIAVHLSRPITYTQRGGARSRLPPAGRPWLCLPLGLTLEEAFCPELGFAW